MGEFLPELGGEDEARVGGDAFEPLFRMVGLERLIEGRVDLDGVEELREISGFVKAFWTRRGIDVTGTIGVRPAGRANANMFQGGEGSAHRLRVGYWSCAFSRHFESTKSQPLQSRSSGAAMSNRMHPRRFAQGHRNCYAVLTMRCGTTICVAHPLLERSYRCTHETFHQLQTRGFA